VSRSNVSAVDTSLTERPSNKLGFSVYYGKLAVLAIPELTPFQTAAAADVYEISERRRPMNIDDRRPTDRPLNLEKFKWP